MEIKTVLTILFSTVIMSISGSGSMSVVPPVSGTSNADFIRTSCRNSYVMYTEACNIMMNPFSKAVRKDPYRLARVALNVALSCAKKVAHNVNNSTVMAMYNLQQECKETLSDARTNIQDSTMQMKNLSGTANEVAFKLSNVQTWCSSALTNVDTCTDGDSPGYATNGAAKQKQISPMVCGGSVDGAYNITSVTSTALSMVNMFADQVRGASRP